MLLGGRVASGHRECLGYVTHYGWLGWAVGRLRRASMKVVFLVGIGGAFVWVAVILCSGIVTSRAAKSDEARPSSR